MYYSLMVLAEELGEGATNLENNVIIKVQIRNSVKTLDIKVGENNIGAPKMQKKIRFCKISGVYRLDTQIYDT